MLLLFFLLVHRGLGRLQIWHRVLSFCVYRGLGHLQIWHCVQGTWASPALPEWGSRLCLYRVVDHNDGEDDGDDDDMYEASVMDELCLISLLNHFIWIN